MRLSYAVGWLRIASGHIPWIYDGSYPIQVSQLQSTEHMGNKIIRADLIWVDSPNIYVVGWKSMINHSLIDLPLLEYIQRHTCNASSHDGQVTIQACL